jgi:hypothetical protein
MDIKAELDECFLPDWDAYGAKPISGEAVKYAQHIYDYFSLKPSPGAEPDGMVTLEWYINKGFCLNLSVDRFGNCYYAYVDKELGQDECGKFSIENLEFLNKFRVFEKSSFTNNKS